MALMLASQLGMRSLDFTIRRETTGVGSHSLARNERPGPRRQRLRPGRLSASYDDTAKMMWGDVGKLYFMIRPDDLQARRFDQARFMWQCS